MNTTKFYRCEQCGSVFTGSKNGQISCCGKQLEPLVVQAMDERHQLTMDEMEDEYYITMNHPMTKAHYIAFVAWTAYDRTMLVRMYPEQNAELRLNLPRQGDVYVYCSQHGLFRSKITFRKQ